jgi:hypothetical protein
MQLSPHVAAIQADLAAAAALGDEAAAAAAQRLADAVGSSLQLRLLELLGEAARFGSRAATRNSSSSRSRSRPSRSWPRETMRAPGSRFASAKH